MTITIYSGVGKNGNAIFEEQKEIFYENSMKMFQKSKQSTIYIWIDNKIQKFVFYALCSWLSINTSKLEKKNQTILPTDCCELGTCIWTCIFKN